MCRVHYPTLALSATTVCHFLISDDKPRLGLPQPQSHCQILIRRQLNEHNGAQAIGVIESESTGTSPLNRYFDPHAVETHAKTVPRRIKVN